MTAFVTILAGGLLGFALSVGFYAIRQRLTDREAARLAEDLRSKYRWERVNGKMVVIPFDQDGAA